MIWGAKNKFKSNEICCNYDIETDECDNPNYITTYYNIEEQAYNFSLLCEECYENIGYLMVNDSTLDSMVIYPITRSPKQCYETGKIENRTNEK